MKKEGAISVVDTTVEQRGPTSAIIPAHQAALLKLINKPRARLKTLFAVDSPKKESLPSSFHQSCDGKAPTFTVATLANGWVVGAYTEVAFTSFGGSKKDPHAFLFRIPPGAARAEKYTVKTPQYAVYDDPRFGPNFSYDLAFFGTYVSSRQDNYDLPSKDDKWLLGPGSHRSLKRLVVLQVMEDQEPDEEWNVRSDDIIYKKKIGEGAYGVVYLAKVHGQPVAVKHFKTECTPNAGMREKLKREIAIMSKVTGHSNCTKLYGAVPDTDNCLRLVMEYVANGNMYNLLMGNVQGKIPLSRVISLAADAAKGLAFLHSKFIVHRDVAARNVLVSEEPMCAKISDFGLSRTIDVDSGYDYTRNAGNIRYMAPEEINALSTRRFKVSPSSDVWSFGIFLWEIGAGYTRRPFNGEDLVIVYEKLRQGVTPDPTGLHPQLIGLVKACWAYDPKQRPPMYSVKEWLRALARTLRQEERRGRQEESSYMFFSELALTLNDQLQVYT